MSRPPAPSRPNRVAARLGLPAAGLTSLTPRNVWAWVEQVRTGGISPAQAAATLVIVYRTWIVALLLKALGSGWDVAWHFRFIRDDFAPPHNINLIGDGIAIALVLFHWYTRFGVDRLALRLMIGGAALFVFSAPVDVINHRINGLDITSWSITHFGLYTGTGIMIAGVIRGWHVHSAGRSDRSLLLGALWFFFLENVLVPRPAPGVWRRGDRVLGPRAPVRRAVLARVRRQPDRPAGRPRLRGGVRASGAAWVYPVWIVAAVGC